MAIQVVILAAGQGKRMYSKIPKVMHHLGGQPLLARVIGTALHIETPRLPIIVYGHQGEQVYRKFEHLALRWCKQEKQLGTAHAVLQALPEVELEDVVLILYGDVPLISLQTIHHLVTQYRDGALGLITAHLKNPHGYGRILRKDKKIIGIVEERDANLLEKAIEEVNSGIYLCSAGWLKSTLQRIKNNNMQREYYLTDIVQFAVEEQLAIYAVSPLENEEIMGVNSCEDLAFLERFYQKRLARDLMLAGVQLADPARLDIRGEVKINAGVKIDINVIMEGRVEIEEGCTIGPNVILRDCKLSNAVEVKAYSIIEGAEIGPHCVIGPFARIRPHTSLASEVHIGNFVEIKNTKIDNQTKINHLSYIGDSLIGKRVNIGAGTITCNYDGASKHPTTIGHDVHIGSDTQLIAPLTVGEGATIGAGSTVTKNVPAYQLTLTHQLDQRIVRNWVRPQKKMPEKMP